MWRTLAAFKMLLDRRRAKGKDDVYFYVRCRFNDAGNINLIEISEQLKFVQGAEGVFPNMKVFGVSNGFPIEMVNELYNAADFVVSTTLGEEWGLSSVEAMAVGKPYSSPALPI